MKAKKKGPPPRAKVYLYDPPHYESSKGSLLVCPNQPFCLVLSLSPLSLDPCISSTIPPSPWIHASLDFRRIDYSRS